MAGSETIQAVVKVVRKGGTHNAGQIKKQAGYLSRDGDVPLERSERYHGAAVNPDTLGALAQSWAEQTGIVNSSGESSRDLTTHMVVSFPEGTNHDSAYKAAREWAHETFGGQNGQDAYDYLSAMHTERGHPHMHLIINRRGLNQGDWLKIANRHEYFNYERMRQTMVACAGRHGIDMEATSREARGLEPAGLSDPQYRRMQRGEPARARGAAGEGLADPFAGRRNARRGRDEFETSGPDEAQMPPRQRQRPLRDPAEAGPSNAHYAGYDAPELDDDMPLAERQRQLRNRAEAGPSNGNQADDAAPQPEADGIAQQPAAHAAPAGQGGEALMNEPDNQDHAGDGGGDAAMDGPAPRTRKRRADADPRHMELRSDKRARLEQGMQLRSGRNLGAGGQARPAQDRDPRRETR